MAELKIKADSGGGTVSFKGPATTTSNAAVQLTLPVDDGTANQYLKTDGSGALSWATVAVGGATGTDYNDSVKVRLGTDNDLEIEHTGSLGRIKNTTGELHIQGDTIFLRGEGGSEDMIKCWKDGAVKLYHNDIDKLETTAAGVQVTGNLIIGSGSGSGIDFSAQTASSVTNVTVEDEVLDHYEKGTWQPFFYGSSTAGTFSSSVKLGRYVRIGDLVWINMYIQGGSLSGADGELKIGGLPYDLEGNPDAAFTVAYANGFHEMPDNSVLFVLNGGSNTLRILKSAAHYAGNTSGLAQSSDTMSLVIGGCYSVA